MGLSLAQIELRQTSQKTNYTFSPVKRKKKILGIKSLFSSDSIMNGEFLVAKKKLKYIGKAQIKALCKRVSVQY